MSTEPENILLVYLRRLDAKIDKVIETQQEHSHRLSRLDSQLGGVRRDQGSDAETIAHVQARLDRLGDRIDRVERRLDLRDE